MTNQDKIRLVMVDANGNNNKFWFADINGLTVHRKWGRVGYSGQEKTFTYYDNYEAINDTRRMADSKRAKGYKDIDIVEENDTIAVAGKDLEQVALDQIDTGGQKTVQSLIQFLVRKNIHHITSLTSITYTDGQLKTPLGVVSNKSISKARDTLDRINDLVNNKMVNSGHFSRLVEQYMTLVPTNVGMKLRPAEAFGTTKKIDDQYELLDAMESVLAGTNGDTKEEIGQIFNVKVRIENDPTAMTQVERRFRKSINAHHVSSGMRIKSIYTVEMPENDKKFERNLGNVRLLWHGTKASNLLSILKSGFKIVPIRSGHTTGRMFGNGLYFTDQSTKALNYATTFWGGKDEGRYFMLLCEVAMGKSFTPSSPGEYLPKGYDSIFAKAHVSGVVNNEMISFRESQVTIRYLVEFSK